VKIVLNKLNEQNPSIEGDHQHGFRNGRSTVTALLELQHHIASALYRNKHVSTYSVDMSAAFDLLQPSVFHGLNLNEPLMNILMVFMSNRTFNVKVGDALSDTKKLNVGCIQGSILGPKLFNIYCAELKNIIPEESILASYAYDSYVINTSDTKEDLVNSTTHCFQNHINFLHEIGMVINKNKTELLYSTRHKCKEELTIKIEDSTIASKNTIMALGVMFSADLDWTGHLNYAINKSKHVLSRLKFLKKFLTEDDSLCLVTKLRQYGLVP
jgi:hypothetical protein